MTPEQLILYNLMKILLSFIIAVTIIGTIKTLIPKPKPQTEKPCNTETCKHHTKCVCRTCSNITNCKIPFTPCQLHKLEVK